MVGKSSGQQLDQALARQKATKQAREVALARTLGLEQSLATAKRTLQQTKEAPRLLAPALLRWIGNPELAI